MGYGAFGDSAPGNFLTGFGFYNPFWLLDISNAAIVIHLVGAYKVFCQPLFAFIEKWANRTWPDSKFISKEIRIRLSSTKSYKLNLFRLFMPNLTGINNRKPYHKNQNLLDTARYLQWRASAFIYGFYNA
ncbi:amino acid permease 3-like [Dendrobium catenatum]|uniref:amino acid permease 3-like n=1 Tax=Dendrobium catenatum TaxID=906689 RepID=UPI00109F36C2|nr:amino acid permease 3-like [Dendrobium catenatum]